MPNTYNLLIIRTNTPWPTLCTPAIHRQNLKNMMNRVDFSDVFALRYQVYCVEREFLSRDQYETSEESDEFDEFSAHFAAVYEGRVLGNLRLVRPFNATFPFQRHCATFPDIQIQYKRSGEISRLAIAKDRLAGTDGSLGGRLPGGRAICTREAIVLCLLKAMLQFSRYRHIEVWYSAMENSLTRLLSRYGISFRPIGEETDYYGPVKPYFAHRDEVLEGMRSRAPTLHEWMADDRPPCLGQITSTTFEIGSTSKSAPSCSPLEAPFATAVSEEIHSQT